MSEKQLRELINEASEFAEFTFNKDSRVSAGWLYVNGNGERAATPMPCEDKDIAAMLMRALFAILKTRCCVFVDEAWILEKTGDAAEAERLLVQFKTEGIANHPDRVEVVIFSGEDQDVGMLTGRRDIIRPRGERPHLGPLVIERPWRQSQGRLVGMLPQTGKAN
jgi:hypothetical protein